MSATAEALPSREVLACPSCDTLHRRSEGIKRGRALCSQCGQTLYTRKERSIEHTLAYAIAGLILFIPANFFPLVTLSSHGVRSRNDLISGPLDLFDYGFPGVGLLVFLTSILFPAIFLCGLIYVHGVTLLGRFPADFAIALRGVQALVRWAMIDVYILACLVTFIKLADLADVEPGLGLYCLGGVLFFSLLAVTSFDGDVLWQRFTATKGKAR